MPTPAFKLDPARPQMNGVAFADNYQVPEHNRNGVDIGALGILTRFRQFAA
jgi:hypothetical protein